MPRTADRYAVVTPGAALGRRGSLTRARPRTNALATRLIRTTRKVGSRTVTTVTTVPRHNVAGMILATAVAGLLFGPAFGSVLAAGVLVPVGAVAVCVYVAYALARRWPALRHVRFVVALLLGALLIGETALTTTVSSFLPTGATTQGLVEGFRRSWMLVLQSTTPVRAEPELIVFVPELVLLAAVLGVEIVLRTGSRALAIVPSLAVAAVAEGFHPLGVMASVVAVFAYAAAAGLALGVRPPRTRSIASAAAIAAVGALLVGVIDPLGRPAFSLRDHVSSVPPPGGGASPLDNLPGLLRNGQQAAFSVRDARGIDRWTLAVLNGYDGVEFTNRAHLRYLGAGVESPPITGVPTKELTTTVLNDRLPGPSLPSQHGLKWVSALSAVVNESNGTLLAHSVHPYLQYRLHFTVPEATSADLLRAGLDLDPAGGTVFTAHVPDAITKLARAAVGSGKPTITMALKLAQYLRTHYRLAVGANIPSGHSMGQIIHFLLPGNAADNATPTPDSGGRGTSEQFATAYIVMAHALGIPARMAVGFRQPPTTDAGDGTYVIHNSDALAWPEISVNGVGWVPLDPEGTPGRGTNKTQSDLAQALAELNAQLPKSGNIPTPPPSAASAVDVSVGGQTAQTLHGVLVLLLVLGAFLLVAVPSTKFVRSNVRRRRVGREAILSAWRETCDRLLDHGVEVSRSMTVREVADSAATMVDWQLVRAVGHLGNLVDDALWSGDGARPATVNAAWSAFDAVRESLSRRPVAERVEALLTVRSLRAAR